MLLLGKHGEITVSLKEKKKPEKRAVGERKEGKEKEEEKERRKKDLCASASSN